MNLKGKCNLDLKKKILWSFNEVIIQLWCEICRNFWSGRILLKESKAEKYRTKILWTTPKKEKF